MPQTVVRAFRTANGTVPIWNWLAQLKAREPAAFAKCLQRILLLSQFGNELRRPIADYLRDGIYELRARAGKVQYRMLYFFFGPNLACLSHGLTKEGVVPAGDIDVAIRRKVFVERDPDTYTADWEL